MNRLLTKILSISPEKQKKVPTQTLPPLAQIASFKEVHNRSLIAWVVYRMADLAEMDYKNKESLFFHSFSNSTIDKIPDEKARQLFQLARLGVNWLQNNEVIEERLKDLPISRKYRETFTRVLSELHNESIFEQVSVDTKKMEWEVYRDVIYAATNGSFLLIDQGEVKQYKQGEILTEVLIQERGDVPKARNAAKEAFTKIGLKSSKILSYNLIISEAVTNILKHAENGKMCILSEEDIIRVVIKDKGPGFPMKILPKATLMAGFSMKESLGHGFTLMMKIAKQVILETSSSGSTLILILDGKE
ncbi:ATP-binding protein [Gracilibacillus xinjiangensis]|uniref:ATP-binding protein n=1 Tax=Gracilibacillus xinjiangensis TaxID=1193282 RepID=A0ABV8WP83_9BACI